jgi:hypothetical protein
MYISTTKQEFYSVDRETRYAYGKTEDCMGRDLLATLQFLVQSVGSSRINGRP